MIECERLTKRYGKTLALDALELHVGKGELHGFVGPNGAGKTTAMRIFTTLIRPTSGDARIGGVSVTESPERVRRMIGYMPDFFGVYENLRAWEYLDLYAGCLSLGAKERRRRTEVLLELTELKDKREAFVDGLSRGMKQRLCLARAMLHDPALLILDEPASGMDPKARLQMRRILRTVGETGKTVLISSHILPELSELCSAISILYGGKTAFSGPAGQLRRRMNGQAPLLVRFAIEPGAEQLDSARQALGSQMNASLLPGKDGLWEILPAGEEKPAQATAQDEARVLRLLMAQGLPVCAFYREETSLEEIFMEVVRDDAQSDL